MRLLALVIVAVFAVTTLADEAGDVAERALDKHRDAKHREEVRILWPAPAVEQMPRDVDVLLMTGYIGYTCLRFHRTDGGPVVCDRIGFSRTWFYNPDGETFETRRIEIAPERFALAWQAVRRLLAARAELVNSQPPEAEVSIDEDGDGEFDAFIIRMPQLSHSTGSHQSSEWLRVRADEAVLAADCVRGYSSVDGILDFDELRVRAVRQVFLDLAAEGIDAGRPFPAVDWRPGLQSDLARLPPDDGAKHIDNTTRIFCEAAIPILGETGDDDTATAIGAFRWRLMAREPQGVWEEGLRKEADLALQRIDLRQHWDSAKAIRLIHANDGSWHSDNDQEKWIRRMFHERDPAGYLTLLRSDLLSDDLHRIFQTIPAIAAVQPDGWVDDLHLLLDHAHDEVACDAAFAMLGIRRENSHYAADRVAAVTAAGAAALRDDRLVAAWRTIERLAADPRVEIPPGRDQFHRADAVALLTSEACPQPWHWDRERVLRQLEDPAERDPRMLKKLLVRSGFSVSERPVHRPPPEEREFLVGIWRRSLGEPTTVGTATAVAQLAACGDIDSLPAMRRIIDVLEDGCRRSAVFDPPGGPVRFPWIWLDEVVKLRDYVDSMFR